MRQTSLEDEVQFKFETKSEGQGQRPASRPLGVAFAVPNKLCAAAAIGIGIGAAEPKAAAIRPTGTFGSISPRANRKPRSGICTIDTAAQARFKKIKIRRFL